MVNPAVAHEPWSLDDYCRRTMQYLFSDLVSPEEQSWRKGVRENLLSLFDGIATGNARSVMDGTFRLQDNYTAMMRDQFPPVSPTADPDEIVTAYSHDFDVVTPQPTPETA